MTIHRVFAGNLRKYCDHQSSIAEVCRGANINRQQFNKYLSGQIVPGSRTLERLSRYMGIDAAMLFQVDTAGSNYPQHKAISTSNPVQRALFELGIRASNGLKNPIQSNLRTIRDGFYTCYFPLQGQPGFLLRSIMCVKTSFEVTKFSRRTRLRSPSRHSQTLVEGKHCGVVFNTENELHFVAINMTLPHHPSLMCTEGRMIPGSNLSVGIALTRGTNQPYACRICIEYHGEKLSSAKHAYRKMGITSLNDRHVSPMVVTALLAKDSADASQICPPSIEVMMVETNRSATNMIEAVA